MTSFRPFIPAFLLLIGSGPFGLPDEPVDAGTWHVQWADSPGDAYQHFYGNRETSLNLLLWTDPRWSYDLRLNLHQRGGKLTVPHTLPSEQRSLSIAEEESFGTFHTIRWDAPEVKGRTEVILRLEGERRQGETRETLPARTLSLVLYPTVKGTPLASLAKKGFVVVPAPELQDWSSLLHRYGATVQETPPRDLDPQKLIYLATTHSDWPESSPRSHLILILPPDKGHRETIYFAGPGQPTQAVLRLPLEHRKDAHPLFFEKLQSLFRAVETSRPPKELLR